jgi:hypothetical protein
VQQVRGLAVSLFITTFFGTLWGMVGAFALLGAVPLLAGALVGLGCALVLWVSAFPPLVSALRRAGARPH